MRTSPEISARLFVGRVAPGTSKAELRRHFKFYGDVADIWLRHDRPFAFVQFIQPAHAARALAEKNHFINGRRVYIRIAQPTKSSGRLANEMSKYPCQRVCRIGKSFYRIGDMYIATVGPLPDNCEESEYIKNLRRFGVLKDKMLIFDIVIDYISQDGRNFLYSFVVDRSDEAKAVHGNISSTRPATETCAKFCRYCQRAVTPGGSGGNCDGLVHTDACLIYQESFVHYPYCVAVADEWFPVGCFIGDVSNAE
uniref:RRM domain-containing protein n=1 Tax=Oryza meridionalis TaxID=40149 RepID=A0A0E0CZV5_9ORYZ